MPSPVIPSEFRELVPSVNESTIAIIRKFALQSFLWWRWKVYAWNADGTPTDEFIADLCEGRCLALGDKNTYANCLCKNESGEVV